jgi:hypothetical protein
MSDDIDDRPLWEGPVMGSKYKVKVLPIGTSIFTAELQIYSQDDELLYRREVTANRNLPEGAGPGDFKNWNMAVIDWILNKA